MTRWALLRHDLPDGSHHFDWLIERPIWGEHRLLAWRLESPAPVNRTIPSFRARRIPLHRAVYLTFEGPIGRSRGSVTRIADGAGRVAANTPGGSEIEIRTTNATERFVGVRDGRSELFTFTRGAPSGCGSPTLAHTSTSG